MSLPEFPEYSRIHSSLDNQSVKRLLRASQQKEIATQTRFALADWLMSISEPSQEKDLTASSE